MFEFDLEKDKLIDSTDLQNELLKLPSLLYFYGNKKVQAEYEYEVLKAKHEEVRSQEYIKYKSGPEKLTEANVKAMMDTAISVLNVQNKMLEAKRDLNTIKNYMETLHAKKDMLIQLSANQRKEL